MSCSLNTAPRYYSYKILKRNILRKAAFVHTHVQKRLWKWKNIQISHYCSKKLNSAEEEITFTTTTKPCIHVNMNHGIQMQFYEITWTGTDTTTVNTMECLKAALKQKYLWCDIVCINMRIVGLYLLTFSTFNTMGLVDVGVGTNEWKKKKSIKFTLEAS